MPDTRASDTPTPLRRAATVGDVVDLLERYADADRDLADAMDRIGAEVSSSRRVSQNTITRLLHLLEQSLVPGVKAKAELDALPASLRKAGIAAWARQAFTRIAAQPMEGTA